WMYHTPFDRRAHELLLQTLSKRGQFREGDEHLAATIQAFEAEGINWLPLRHVWQEAKAVAARSSISLRHDSGCAQSAAAESFEKAARRASIAVMPFADTSEGVAIRGGPADGLVHDIITRLAKLRNLFVIAQGTVFAFDQRNAGLHEVGQSLGVDYVEIGRASCREGVVTS